MADLAGIAVCTRILEDRRTGNLGLIDLFDNLQIDAVSPVAKAGEVASAIFECFVVLTWVRSKVDAPEACEGRLRILGPDGKTVSRPDTVFEFALNERSRCRTIVNLRGWYYVGDGYYRLVVSVRGQGGQARWRRPGTDLIHVSARPREEAPKQPKAEEPANPRKRTKKGTGKRS